MLTAFVVHPGIGSIFFGPPRFPSQIAISRGIALLSALIIHPGIRDAFLSPAKFSHLKSIAGRIRACGCGSSGNCQGKSGCESNAQDTFEFHTEPLFLKK